MWWTPVQPSVIFRIIIFVRFLSCYVLFFLHNFLGKVVLENVLSELDLKFWNVENRWYKTAVIRVRMYSFSISVMYVVINILNTKWKGITSDTEYLHKLAAPRGANFGLPSLRTSGFISRCCSLSAAVIEPFFLFTAAHVETGGGQGV